MRYFVGIENRAYHHWQIELLIESFRMLKMDERLIIGVGDCEPGPEPFDIRNLVGHKNKIAHKQEQIHSLFAMIVALESGILTQPFAYIHPDMLMVKPLVLDDKDTNIIYHKSNYPDLGLEAIHKLFPKELPCLSMGGVVVFQNTPISYFKYAWNWAKQFSEQAKNDVPMSNCDPIRAGLIASFYNSKTLNAKADYFESTLWDYNLDYGCFIHYRHGLPPLFSKTHYYKIPGEVILADKDPYKVLLDNNPTLATNYMQNVIRSYKGIK